MYSKAFHYARVFCSINSASILVVFESRFDHASTTGHFLDCGLDTLSFPYATVVQSQALSSGIENVGVLAYGGLQAPTLGSTAVRERGSELHS
jgi:hypothetical protein